MYVNKKKRVAKQNARRQKYIDKTQRGVSRNKKRTEQEQRYLSDLKKQGTSHYLVAERAKENAREKANDTYDTIEEFTGKSYSETRRNQSAALGYVLSSDKLKQQAYDELVSESNSRIKSYTKKSEQWIAANEAVMSMPANSSNKQYRKAIQAAKKAIG